MRVRARWMGAAVMVEGPKMVGFLRGRHWRTELACVFLTLSLGYAATAHNTPLVLEWDGRVISLEPYAANIVRITMSIDKTAASGAPGYGFAAKPSDGEWTHERDEAGNDVFQSSRMALRVSPGDRRVDASS